MSKEEIRSAILAQLKGQDRTVKAARDAQLTATFLASSSYQATETVATYLSMSHEFDTKGLIVAAQSAGKRLLVPKTYAGGRMIFVPFDEDNLFQTKFGVWEPKAGQEVPKSEIDLIHVPGLAFNLDGYRIGYGGGFYDRYLADYGGKTLSTLYTFQQQAFKPDTLDIPVKELLICE